MNGKKLHKLAIISDIHGNVTALQAVIKDIQDNSVDKIICLGDLIGKGPRSKEAIDICMNECDVILKGNWDEMISKRQNTIKKGFDWYASQLDTVSLKYLSALPNCCDVNLNGKNLRFFHASAMGVYNRVYEDDDIEKKRQMFENTEFTGTNSKPDIVGYGDIHYAYINRAGGKTLFNAGSVGNPLDVPESSYVVIETKYKDDVAVNFKRVKYDIEKELLVAKKSNMPFYNEYETELRTCAYCKRK